MPSFWENLRFPGEREMDDLHGAQGQDMVTYVSAPSPSEGNSFPAVIVIMEAFGVTNHIEKVCDQYAANGYVAIAPVKITDKTNPKIIKLKLPLAAPTTPITLSKLIVISANKTLYTL